MRAGRARQRNGGNTLLFFWLRAVPLGARARGVPGFVQSCETEEAGVAAVVSGAYCCFMESSALTRGKS